MASSRVRSIVDLTAAIAMIVASGVLVWAAVRPNREPPPPPPERTRPAEPIPAEPVSLEGLHLKGSPSARIAIVEHGDFECGACATFATTTLPALAAKYIDTGRVRFGFRHFPLPNHRRAMPAAVAAHCAGEQGRFWEMQDALFEDPSRLDDDGLRATAKGLSLDVARWSTCLEGDAAAVVRRDVKEGRTLALNGTPTFLVGTIGADGRLRVTARFFGAKALSEFDVVIEAAEQSLRSGN